MADLQETLEWVRLSGNTLEGVECQAIAHDLLPVLEAVQQTLTAVRRRRVDDAQAGMWAIAEAGLQLADELTAPMPDFEPSRPTVAQRKAWETRVRRYGPTGRRQPGVVTPVDF